MHTITKIIEWDMGHRVPNHKSKCRNLHGHRYRLEVTVTGELCSEEGSSSEGMVIDFGDIKKLMTEKVHDVFDHGFMVYREDLYRPILQQILDTDPGHRIIVVDFIPTAENMAKHIWKILEESIEKEFDYKLHVFKVRLYETPNSWADYGPGS